MTTLNSDLTIIKTLFLKAPATHVWTFLTEKDKLALWFHAGEENLSPDSDYILVTNSHGKEGERLCWGKVIEYDPPRKLIHSFSHEWLKGVETTCVWTLTEVSGGTVLRLEHTGFDQVKEDSFGEAADHDKGWDEHFIRLRRVTI